MRRGGVASEIGTSFGTWVAHIPKSRRRSLCDQPSRRYVVCTTSPPSVLPDSAVEYEQGGLSGAVVDSLKAMGHTVATRGGLATANSILSVKGGWHGMGEPRSGGTAVGY